MSRYCMFHPVDHPMERGWVGRIDGDRVVHLAAQTLQSLFTGGGSAREHAEYRLPEVCLLAPVLHPPAVRIFQDQDTFEFANPAAIVGPGAEIGGLRSACNSLLQSRLTLLPRVAAVIGAEGSIAGFTAFADWRRVGLLPPKDRDFALGLGPLVVTPDELDPDRIHVTVRVDGHDRVGAALEGFDWTRARDFAADDTVVRPGDLVAGPAAGLVEDLGPGSAVELVAEGIGVLAHVVVGD